MTAFLFPSIFFLFSAINEVLPESKHILFCRVFWRVVIDSSSNNTGVAVIGVNNPYLTEDEVDTDNYRVCSPPTKNHPFLENTKPKNITLGIMYVCKVEEAAKAFAEIRSLDLGDMELLT